MAELNTGLTKKADTCITLNNGSGRNIEFELLDFISYSSEVYAVLIPAPSETECTAVIVKIIQMYEDSWTYGPIEDAHTLAAVFSLFHDKYGTIFDFAA